MEKTHQEILALVDVYKTEYDMVIKGNKAAAARARKALMDIKKKVSDQRKNISDYKASLPTKGGGKKSTK